MTADGSLDPACLKPVRKLGEGAFAVVEEALYTPAAPVLLPSPSLDSDGAVPPAASDSATSPAGSGGDGAGAGAGGGPIGNGARASSGQLPSVVANTSGKARGGGAAVTVAIKRLKPEIVNHQQDLQSFLAEAALMRKLHHKRIVEFIGVGSTDASSEDAKRRSMFLVQEFMDGGTLKKVVSRQMIDVTRRLYSCADAFRWGLQVAEGLEYLHSARPMVIHRDLKLENILMKGKDLSTADAKIADFGLVALVQPRARAPAQSLKASAASALQRAASRRGHGGAGQMLQRLASRRSAKSVTLEGTWDETFKAASHIQRQMSISALNPPQQLSGRTGSYMAPEMYRQEAYNEKVDVFSFGVILFEVLNRYQMVCAISIAGTEEEIEGYAAKARAARYVSEGYRPPLPQRWPDAVKQLISDCWAQDPAARPSMAVVRSRIAGLIASGAPEEMQEQLTPMSPCSCTIS
ncbi:hypothetical protein HYH02_013908 [Chlamydomonas schloesseri]|uniref:Protein kinase domain-containing protein n=1 Tax=Chlamydomonas schloesseri TaxID=2026947 RepID=A0A835VUM3_9CHLO|nr:hypothetical protein HYH02_013908 [Chlamydomonas schloesseri]|eukprot:KAG2429957.1 hypothetical protein HYH02_013908 [Chlamydomonas schloesseri]